MMAKDGQNVKIFPSSRYRKVLIALHHNLRAWLEVLAKEKELVVVEAPVDPHLELAEIHRRVVEKEGPALLFVNVLNSNFPVVTNLLGTARRIDLAFGPRPEQLVRQLMQVVDRLLPPRWESLWEARSTLSSLLKIGSHKVQNAPVLQKVMDPVDLNALPILTSWPDDGGPFITLPLVYTEPPDGGPSNLGMYRMQRYDSTTAGMHFQIQKGGGFHYNASEKKGQALPVQVFLGGPPALLAAAIAPLPESIPELLLASFLLGKKLPVTQSNCPAEAEFLITGTVNPFERKIEGPFGDHYGFYSLAHPFPVFHTQSIHHRHAAIYPATIVGKPPQEDFYLGEFLQRLLSPIFPHVMPGVRDLWTYAESGFHALAAARVQERYSREALVHALRILGEGQLSLTKCLLVTDQWVNLRNISHCLTTILERIQPEKDLIILPKTSADTLDYTGKKFNHGSKMILLGTGKKILRTLPVTPDLPHMQGIEGIAPFCPGVLVMKGQPYEQDPQQAENFLQHYGDLCADWPLLVLVDSLQAAQDSTSFLWNVFMRFDPNLDLYSKTTLHKHHLHYSLPILIDARHKPHYPDEVTVDEVTKQKVSDRWHTYFPHPVSNRKETFPTPPVTPKN